MLVVKHPLQGKPYDPAGEHTKGDGEGNHFRAHLFSPTEVIPDRHFETLALKASAGRRKSGRVKYVIRQERLSLSASADDSGKPHVSTRAMAVGIRRGHLAVFPEAWEAYLVCVKPFANF
jgi:hypothetical protein